MKDFSKGIFLGLAIGLLLLFTFFLFYAGVYRNSQSPEKYTADTPAESNMETAAQQETEEVPQENNISQETGGAAGEEASEAALETAEHDAAESTPETTAHDASEAIPEAAEETLSEAVLAFAGDVMFSEQYLSAYDKNGVQALADADMLGEMQQADLLLLNEEFPFSLRGAPMEDKQYTFCTDPKYVSILQELGADIVTVANNHALDFGTDAFCDTLDTLKQAKIACIGGGYNITEASAPAVRTVNGQTFAVFAATRVSPSYDWYATDHQPGLFQTYDPAKLNAAIADAEEQYDHVIVFVHWGIEHVEYPEDYQRTLAKGYIDAGADLIVGCHPHILQGFEYYNGIPIVYSLGNYLFGNRDGDTLLLKAVFSADGALDIRLIPCRRQNGILSRIQEPAALFQHLSELSFEAEVSPEGRLLP